jgi:hypothetical protein
MNYPVSLLAFKVCSVAFILLIFSAKVIAADVAGVEPTLDINQILYSSWLVPESAVYYTRNGRREKEFSGRELNFKSAFGLSLFRMKMEGCFTSSEDLVLCWSADMNVSGDARYIGAGLEISNLFPKCPDELLSAVISSQPDSILRCGGSFSHRDTSARGAFTAIYVNCHGSSYVIAHTVYKNKPDIEKWLSTDSSRFLVIKYSKTDAQLIEPVKRELLEMGYLKSYSNYPSPLRAEQYFENGALNEPVELKHDFERMSFSAISNGSAFYPQGGIPLYYACSYWDMDYIRYDISFPALIVWTENESSKSDSGAHKSEIENVIRDVFENCPDSLIDTLVASNPNYIVKGAVKYTKGKKEKGLLIPVAKDPVFVDEYTSLVLSCEGEYVVILKCRSKTDYPRSADRMVYHDGIYGKYGILEPGYDRPSDVSVEIDVIWYSKNKAGSMPTIMQW